MRLYAFNGVGQTRLSIALKDAHKQNNRGSLTRYLNAFAEDLSHRQNDLAGSVDRRSFSAVRRFESDGTSLDSRFKESFAKVALVSAHGFRRQHLEQPKLGGTKFGSDTNEVQEVTHPGSRL